MNVQVSETSGNEMKLTSLYYNKCNLERNLFHKNE